MGTFSFVQEAQRRRAFSAAGGNVDDDDDDARAGAVREFYEETGLRVAPERLTPACCIKKRQYFTLQLTDEDSIENADGNVAKPISGEAFYLKLSSEHTGFTFVSDVHAASEMIKKHSGGHGSNALLVVASASIETSTSLHDDS